MFVTNTELELDYLLKNNFNETIDNFDQTLNTATDDMKSLLDQTKANINFDEVVDTIQMFSKFAIDYNNITTEVTNLVSQIDKISEVCNVPECNIFDELKEILAPIASMNFNSEVMDAIADVDSTLNLVSLAFDDIVSDFTNDYFNEIDNQIEDIRKTLVDQNEEIKNALDELRIKNINWGDNWESYTDSFYISATVFISFLLVLIILFLIPGWNVAKIAASIYLIIGIMYFLVIAVFFAVGSLGEKAVCTAIDNPANSEFIPLFDDVLLNLLEDAYGMEDSDEPLNITLASVLSGIKKEESVYPLLQLYHLYNVSELKNNWKDEYDINSYIADAKSALGDAIDSTVFMKNDIPNLDEELGEITNTIQRILKDNIGILIETDIHDYLNDIPNIPPLNDLIEQFEEDFTALQITIEDSLSIFEDGNYNLTGIVNNLTTTINYAFEYIDGEGRTDFVEFLNSAIADLLGVVQTYLDFAVVSLDRRIGSTKPLNNMVNALDSVICDAFIDSINLGKWISIMYLSIK